MWCYEPHIKLDMNFLVKIGAEFNIFYISTQNSTQDLKCNNTGKIIFQQTS